MSKLKALRSVGQRGVIRHATTPTQHQIAISGQLLNWARINEDKDRVFGRVIQAAMISA
jgi:hypothetical protein